MDRILIKMDYNLGDFNMINQKEKLKLITIKYYHDYVSVPKP